MSHQKLLIKLQAYGISDNLLSWLEAYLSNRTQAVKVKGHLSNSGDVINGVPQGSVIGPTPFLIYINDVADTFTNNSVKFKLFADSTQNIKLYSKSSFRQNSSLQTAINGLVLVAWSNKWQLQLAPEKCIQISIKTSCITKLRQAITQTISVILESSSTTHSPTKLTLIPLFTKHL